MNWEAIGAVGEVIGSVAVIATILYLAVQIRQNTRQLESNSLQSMADRVDARMLTVATDADLSELLVKLNEPDRELTPAENLRLTGWLATWINDLEEVYRQSRLSKIPEAALLGRLANLQAQMGNDTMRQIWVQMRSFADPDFVMWAESHMELDIPPLEIGTPKA